MYDQLDLAINNIKETEEELTEEYIPQRKYLKSLIIESNSTLEDIKTEDNIQFIPTREDSIRIIKIIRNDKTTYSYLDLLDSRFWILYSLDTSIDIKKEVKGVIEKNNSRLDYTWLSSDSLQVLSCNYQKTSFSMRFYNSFSNENIPLKKLSIRLWAEDSEEIIKNLFNNEYIGLGACLSNVESKQTNNGKFVKTRLSMDGSLNVSKGNSINELLEYQQKIIEGHYKPIINKIESEYATGYEINDGINVKGKILSIKIKIDDIEKFSKNLLKGVYPFRFVGFANKITEDDYLLNVLDTHTYNRFDLEIFHDEILINLPKDTCGNCVTRLFALCQERIDPKADLRGDEGSIIKKNGWG